MKRKKRVIFIIFIILVIIIAALFCIIKFSAKKEIVMEAYFQFGTGNRSQEDKVRDEFTWYCPAYHIAVYDNNTMHISVGEYSRSLRSLWLPETTENQEKVYIGEENTKESDFIPDPDLKNDVKLSDADMLFIKEHLENMSEQWAEEKTAEHALGYHSNDYIHFYKYNGEYLETFQTEFYAKHGNDEPDRYSDELLKNTEELDSFFKAYLPEMYREPEKMKEIVDRH